MNQLEDVLQKYKSLIHDFHSFHQSHSFHHRTLAPIQSMTGGTETGISSPLN